MKARYFIIPALFILSLVGISNFGGPVTWGFFFVVLSIPLMCFSYIFAVMMSLRIYQKPEGRSMVSGCPSPFTITLQNEGWFSFSSLRIIFYSSFSTISGIEDSTVYEIPPHSGVRKETQLVCRYRGEYSVGIKKIVVGDFLGLFYLTYPIKEPLTVIVAPAMVNLQELRDAVTDEDTTRDSLVNRTRPDIPVREYFPGDELRFINWKASALMQKLMVRETIGEGKDGIALILEPRRFGKTTEEYLPPENKIIECVLALSLYYIGKNIPVDVFYGPLSPNMRALRSHGDVEQLYSDMTSYSFREEGKLAGIMPERGGLSGYRELGLITERFGNEEYALMEEMNTEHLPLRVYLIEGEAETELPRGMKVIPIGAGDALTEVL